MLGPLPPRGVDLEELPQQQIPRGKGSHFPIYVTHVNGLNDIWVCLATKQEQLEKLMEEMNMFYQKKSRTSTEWIVGDSPRCVPGRIFAATYKKEGYHRVLVRKHVGGSKVQVFYLDYGTCEVVERSKLRFLHKDFLSIPAQAVEARLWGLEFSQVGDRQRQRHEVMGRLTELVRLGNKAPFGLMAVVKNGRKDNRVDHLVRLRLHLWIVDLTLETSFSINEQIVKDGIAVFSRTDIAQDEVSEDIPHEIYELGRREVDSYSSKNNLLELVNCLMSRVNPRGGNSGGTGFPERI